MKEKYLYIVLICIVSAILFFTSNHNLRGYLRDPKYLAAEIKTPLDSIYQYKLASEAPFKYRLLFPAIIKGSFAVINPVDRINGFFYTYKGWSLVFYMAAPCCLFFLLLTVGFSEKQSLAGSIVFMLMPPMLLAYTLPVHTREDPLAFSIFFLGLITIVRDKKLPFIIIALVGALCRETLLLLPLLYFFFSDDRSFIRRAFISGLPVLLWLSVRVLSKREPYDVWEGLNWNLHNPEQVVGFLFITFNICWISFFIFIAHAKKWLMESSGPLRFFYKTAIFSLLVIMITTFLGGIYNEIRLLYLFSPWMIVLFLDCLRRYQSDIQKIFAAASFKLYALLVIISCSAILFFVLKYQDKIIVPGKWAVPYSLWIVCAVFYILCTALFFPVVFKVFSLKRSQ